MKPLTAAPNWAVTIDCGTSNTRATVWHGRRVIARAQRGVGVRDTALTGSRAKLQEAVREVLQEGLALAGVPPSALQGVFASGMITSPLGLHEVPHVPAPAGLAELAAATVRATAPDAWPEPMVWIPGVRNDELPKSLANVEAFDMMRGEEAEVIGLLDRLSLESEAVVVLPGSHTKLLRVDAQGRILASATTLSGELLELLSTRSLLSASVNGCFAEHLDLPALQAGADASIAVGLARAAFGVRLADARSLSDPNGRACYLLGAVLAGDVQALQASQALRAGALGTPVWVCGRPLVQQAMVHLLRSVGEPASRVCAVPQDQQEDLAGWGALLIARQAGMLAG
jgi:2-dehydro-3-deoxygalactonokinase